VSVKAKDLKVTLLSDNKLQIFGGSVTKTPTLRPLYALQQECYVGYEI